MARKKKHPEHVNHERWLVSYADFITLLFAFFTTLYAISTVDQKKAGKLQFSMRTAFNVDFFKTDGPPPPGGLMTVVEGLLSGSGKKPAASVVPKGGKKPIDGVAQRLAALAEHPALRGRFQVRMEARGLVVSLAEAGFFESGSASIKEDALGTVTDLAKILSESGMAVTIEGHTDNVPMRRGRYATNWELSTARATAVVAFFIEQGLAPELLSAAGYGEYRPVSPNDTPEGRTRNRRVDVVIQPQSVDVDVSTAPEPSKLTASDRPTSASL